LQLGPTLIATISDSVWTKHFIFAKGAVHKVRRARGGGGPRRCDSLWQGGSRACDVTLIQIFIIHM